MVTNSDCEAAAERVREGIKNLQAENDRMAKALEEVKQLSEAETSEAMRFIVEQRLKACGRIAEAALKEELP